jgi:hypothetical protein
MQNCDSSKRWSEIDCGSHKLCLRTLFKVLIKVLANLCVGVLLVVLT